MHKDTLVFLPEHEKKAKQILDLLLEYSVKKNYREIACIAGCSGTGKSEISWFLSRQLYKLGISSHIVNLDRMYLSPPDKRDYIRKTSGIIGKSEIDWERVNKEIKMFDNNDINMLIVEGIYAGYCSSGIKFLIKGTPEEMFEFRKLRNKENEDDGFRKHVVRKEYEEVLDTEYDYII